uniref:Uncharacterized protein n=1 Tax=Anguilla anguilla TaxID=7936 RepID=A0A0E9S2V7_ANGAN
MYCLEQTICEINTQMASAGRYLQQSNAKPQLHFIAV